MNRKVILLAGIAILLLGLGWNVVAHQQDQPTVVVYKTPTCGCCSKWVDHMKAAGFTVETHDLNDLSQLKRQHGVGRAVSSCHTALVDGYVVEGHVPADQVMRLLKERPNVKGLAVPGMPIGSPGMEQGGRVDPYNVVTFDEAGRTTVFARID